MANVTGPVETSVFDTLREGIPLSDGFYFAAVVEMWHLAVFLFFAGIYLVVERVPALDRYRIHPHTPRDPKLTKKTLEVIGGSHLFSIPYIRYIMWPVFCWGGGLTLTGPMPPAHVVALQIFGSMLLEDTLFYWVHRALHHRLLYAAIHKQHHEYKITYAYAFEYSSALEQTLANVIPTYAGAFFFNMHIGVLMLWLFLRIWETADAHSGYVLPWSPWNQVLAIQGGTARHDYHHSHNMGAYGSLFKFWDWAMGTDKAFREFEQKQKQQAQAAKTE